MEVVSALAILNLKSLLNPVELVTIPRVVCTPIRMTKLMT